MKYRNLFAALIMLLICVTAGAQDRKEPLRINYGVKAGFQAITYNSIDFDIAGYSFNDNTIQSDKVGFFVAPFIRFTKNNFYLIFNFFYFYFWRCWVVIGACGFSS